MKKKANGVDRPVYDKTYYLTGKEGEKCLLNGNTWAESEAKIVKKQNLKGWLLSLLKR